MTADTEPNPALTAEPIGSDAVPVLVTPPVAAPIDPNGMDQEWTSTLIALDISGGPGAERIVAEGDNGDAPARFCHRRLRDLAPEIAARTVLLFRRTDLERWSPYARLLAEWDRARKPTLISGGMPMGVPEVTCIVQQSGAAIQQRALAADLVQALHMRAPGADILVHIEDAIREYLNRFPGP